MTSALLDQQHDDDLRTGSPSDWRAIRLTDLVSAEGVSVRLRNSIIGAHARNELQIITVGAYVDMGPRATELLLHTVANFGRNSARELEALIQYVTRIDPNDRARAAAEGVLRRETLLSLFAGDTVGSITAKEVLSARLQNVLADPHYADMSFGDLLNSFMDVERALRRTPNCGRRSVDEFGLVCRRHVARTLAAHGLSHADRTAAAEVLFISAASSDPTDSSGSAVEGERDPALLVPEHESLNDRMRWLLDQVTERPRNVLRSRFGIDQVEPETLGEIGLRYGVTRERIRQLESHGLRQLKTHARRAPIEPLLATVGPDARRVLFDGGATLRTTSLSERRKWLDPLLMLALEVRNLTVGAWLDEIATRLPLGWCDPGLSKTEVEAAAAALQSDLAALELPIALRTLATEHAPELVAAACELVLGQRVQLGYLMPPRVGPRLSRIIGLHAVLKANGDTMPVSLLVARYHRHFPGDPCSQRDAEIVMTMAPHLFLEITDGNWRAIGSAGALLSTLTAGPPLSFDETFEWEEEGTIAHSLQVALQPRGLSRLGDLMEEAAEILPEGRSVNSIGPVLLTRTDLFVRALPGVYGLPGAVPQPGHRLPAEFPILLNEHQARLFALARYAEEPRSAFPLWSLQAEIALCGWARHSASKEIFNSLLAVAEIEDWPLDGHDQQGWIALRAQQARFEIGSSLRTEKAYDRPPLDRLLAACLFASDHGSINWMAANRILGRKIDSHAGAGLVALMIHLGLVSEREQTGFRWQRAHTPRLALGPLCKRLMNDLAKGGDLYWESALGGEIIREVVAGAAQRDSWIDQHAVVAMMTTSPQPASSLEPEDAAEAVIQEHLRAKAIERREAALQRLLDE